MTTTRVSTAADGEQGNGYSGTGISGVTQMSADGRYIVFASNASNLVADDTNGLTDIFVKDTLSGAVTRVSTSGTGDQSNGYSSSATISADGTRVAFSSAATNLVTGDTNGQEDVFVKDLGTGTVTRVSTSSTGAQGTGGASSAASISADGTRIAFASAATNLVTGDSNGQQDIFVKDLGTGTTTRVSTSSTGNQATGLSFTPSISADGTRVAFSSAATNLVTGDTNGQQDVFVKNLSNGTTTRVSTSSTGAQSTGGASSAASISADGTRIAFQSNATNLVIGDTNGQQDIFVKNLGTGITTRVSTTSTGAQATVGMSLSPSISADGTRVAFQSTAGLVADDTNSFADIFVKNLSDGTTTRVSTASDGTQAATFSTTPSISGDGTRIIYNSEATNLVADDTNGANDVFLTEIPCYASGTRILTVRGEVAVEDLQMDDLAVTAFGQARPIRWLGHRTLACRGRADRLPVRIVAHAFGRNRPARDLFVSPAHAIAVNVLDEVLIPACRLINGTTVTQVEADEVTYWHVELDSHDILLAEGLPAESYLDCDNRRFFANADATDLMAAPDDRPEGVLPFCRPLYEEGPLVDLVRTRLQDRAEALGWRKVYDGCAGLHLVADGLTIRPDVEGLTARFVVPAEARDVRLVSATSVPAHVLSGSTDDRRLGVALATLSIDDGLTGARQVALDDARLGIGFHAVEDGARWTDGSTLLPADLWTGCKGSFFLRMTLAGPALPHWIAPDEMTGVVDPAHRRQA